MRIGVIVPAHEESATIGDCLRAISTAAGHPAVAGCDVTVTVAVDACSDGTELVARAAGVRVRVLDERCVGAARAAATETELAAGAQWIASTDADTLVAPDWLAIQVAFARAGWDAVCGIVDVHDWLDHPTSTRRAFTASYSPVDGHAHVHGASLGVSAAAYRDAGGWLPLPAHEDVALVAGLVAAGCRVARSADLRVSTSARRDARARGGFGDYLVDLTEAG